MQPVECLVIGDGPAAQAAADRERCGVVSRGSVWQVELLAQGGFRVMTTGGGLTARRVIAVLAAGEGGLDAHLTMSLGAAHGWDANALCWRPRLSAAGETTVAGLSAIMADEPPARSHESLPDDAMICACEGVTAGMVRRAAAEGALGPNQVKTATRCGMGACQGRQCLNELTLVIAEARGLPPQEVGHLRIRPPLRPLTLGELAALA